MITLAAAAEGVLPNTDKPHLLPFLKKKEPSTDFNRVINWVKHSSKGAETMGICEADAVTVIVRAITKFMTLYEPETTVEFEEFFLVRKCRLLAKGGREMTKCQPTCN